MKNLLLETPRAIFFKDFFGGLGMGKGMIGIDERDR